MSNSSDESISHNVYFEGKVQSLGLTTAKGKATLGVMKKGMYTFTTSSPEVMVIVEGSMQVRLENGLFINYTAKNEFTVPGGSSFDVVCDDDVAYLCYYG